MPIRKEELARYPADWKQISLSIKERAGWRCECEGECAGLGHQAWSLNNRQARCPNLHGQASEFTGAKVVLTTAHLDHVPEHCQPENLKSYCNACHLNYDRAQHAKTRANTRAARQGISSQGCALM